MKKDQVLSVLRHILTFGGGLLVAKGTLDAGLVAEATGALLGLVGAVWGIAEKVRRP